MRLKVTVHIDGGEAPDDGRRGVSASLSHEAGGNPAFLAGELDKAVTLAAERATTMFLADPALHVPPPHLRRV